MSKVVFKCIDAHTCGNPVRVVTYWSWPKLSWEIDERKASTFFKRISIGFEKD